MASLARFRGLSTTSGFAIAGVLSRLHFGHGIRARFVARRRPGSRAFDPCCFDLGCLRSAPVGRVSPRRATTFLVKIIKNALPQRRLAPVPSLHPKGRRKTRPGGLGRPRAASALQKGEGCCRLGFAIAGGLWCLRRHGIRERFVAPAQAGVQGFDPCCSVLGLPSVGGDWPGLAPAGDLLSCGDKERRQRSAPCRSAGSRRFPRSTRARRVASKLALAGSDIDATIPAGHGLLSALQKGKATAGSASPLPAGCGAFV